MMRRIGEAADGLRPILTNKGDMPHRRLRQFLTRTAVFSLWPASRARQSDKTLQ
jgi:hypothetical protein